MTPESPSIFPNCIFCGNELTNSNYSKDHVFPEIIGGRFCVDFVCRECNSRFGSSFESDLRRNPYVHWAKQSLGIGIPHSHLKGQKMTGTTTQGHVAAVGVTGKKRDITLLPTRQSDGSWVAGDKIAKQNIVQRLKAMGKSDEFIRNNYLELRESTPSGIWIPIEGTGMAFRRLENEPLAISFDEMKEPFRYGLVAKIAIELYVRSGLLWSIPVNISQVIEATLENDWKKLCVSRIDYSHIAPPEKLKYEPFYYAQFAVISKHIVTLVGFFGRFPFAICMGEVQQDSAANCQTHYWQFPVGQEWIQKGIPPANIRQSHYHLIASAYGEWLRRKSLEQ